MADASLLMTARSIYRGMLRARSVDAKLTRLQRQGRIGFHIGAEGEEGAIIASAEALRPQDWIFPCYREVGAALHRGYPLQLYVDNMFGNADDPARGRQMPDHITGRPVCFASVSSPIGTQISQAVGFAWAAKRKHEDVITAAYFGEGATSSNEFHAALTFAGRFKIGTIFLLRNNGWAISLPAARQSATATFAEKGSAYGVPAVRCDGNDALAVFAAVAEAVERAANDQGPTLIEMVTYRLGGHSTSDDPAVYRDAGEVAAHAERDPLRSLRAFLESRDAWSEAEERACSAELSRELTECIERAEQTPPPDLGTMFEDVFEQLPPHLVRQRERCLRDARTGRAS